MTGGLAFLGSWVAMHRHIATLTQRVDALQNHVHRDTKARIDAVEERCTRQDARMERIEEKSRTFVTDDQFGAYTGQTTSTLSRLTEMVGRLNGALEAWGRKP